MLPVSDKTYPKSLKSMKEVTFIRRNIEKWKGTEKVVEQAANLSPDQLADAYTELTADLAFAQTHFPTSRITIYLNNLASACIMKSIGASVRNGHALSLSGHGKCRRPCMIARR